MLSSRLLGMNSSLEMDLHEVPGVLFECGITPLHTISGSAQDFHLQLQLHYVYILLRQESDWKKNTQKDASREKKCVYSAHLRQTVHLFYLPATLQRNNQCFSNSVHPLFHLKMFVNSHTDDSQHTEHFWKHSLNKLYETKNKMFSFFFFYQKPKASLEFI